MSKEEIEKILVWLEAISDCAEPLSVTYIIELEVNLSELNELRALIKSLKAILAKLA